MISGGSAVGSTAIAVLLALLREGLDTRLRTDDRVRAILGVATRTCLPRIARPVFGRRPGPAEVVAAQSNGAYAEALRGLRRRVARRCPDTRQTVTPGTPVTYRLPGEAAGSVACGLAATATMQGLRTALVDLGGGEATAAAGLRRGAQIEGEAREDGATPCPALPDLDVHRGSTSRGLARVLLLDAGARAAVEALRERYDRVVVSGPPMLTSGDADMLADLADAVVLVVRWGVTAEGVLQDVATHLISHPAPIAGAVLADVDERRHAAGRPHYRRARLGRVTA